MKVEIQGQDELIALFSRVKESLAPMAIRTIARKAAKPVLEKAYATMPITGKLGAEIRSRIRKVIVVKNVKGNKGAIKVTVSNTYINLDNRNISVGKVMRHNIGEGPQSTRHRKTGQSTGKVADRYEDFVQRALESSRKEVEEIVSKETYSVISKQFSKLK